MVCFFYSLFDLISQELCLLCGIIKQKIVVYIVVTGPPMMKTTLAATIEKEAGTIITPGVLIFTTITRRNLETMVVPSIFPWPIMPIILGMMLFHHLWKGGNIQPLYGKKAINTMFHPWSMIISLRPVIFKLLLQDPMVMPPHQLSSSTAALFLKMISLSSCQGMRLIDTLHLEKTVLMCIMRHTCVTPTVPSFRISECVLSCKSQITRSPHIFVIIVTYKNI